MKKISELFQKSKKYYEDKLSKKYPDFKLILKNDKPVVIFGAGRMGKVFFENLQKKGVKAIAFADNNKKLHNTKINSIPVISFKELQKIYFDYPILIASLLYETPIYEKLVKQKFKYVFPLIYLNYVDPKIFVSPEYENTFSSLFKKTNQKEISQVYDLLEDNESRKTYYNLIKFRLTSEKKYVQDAKTKQKPFFDKKALPLSSSETFVDCGGYDGDSIKIFSKAVKNKFNKIYSFEPDKYNFKILKAWINTKNDKRLVPVKLGVFNKTGSISFNEGGTVDSRISDKNTFIPGGQRKKDNLSSISIVKIDDYFKDLNPPTLIKMDIEGAEIEALLGAEKTINKYKPKLAISIYHHSTDFWKIPLLIKKMNKNYKFYVRHYTDELPDTICYAI